MTVHVFESLTESNDNRTKKHKRLQMLQVSQFKIKLAKLTTVIGKWQKTSKPRQTFLHFTDDSEKVPHCF